MSDDLGNGASGKPDRAGGPADLSRSASQPEALIPSATEEPNPVGTVRERLAWAIKHASVPHRGHLPGSLESRSLSYYASVGIDHFNHDHARLDRLMFKAADAALAMIAQGIEAGTATTEGRGAQHESPTPTGDAPSLPSRSTIETQSASKDKP